jgi:diacylglycerol kinase (ATP)
MMEFFQSRGRSFRHAFQGLWFMLRTQRNAWIHTVATMIVFLIAFWLGLQPIDWALLIVAIAMVWTAEFINTALEVVVDLASPEQHYLAKVGKDVGAAAVLIASLSSMVIGLLILGPPLWSRILSLVQR